MKIRHYFSKRISYFLISLLITIPILASAPAQPNLIGPTTIYVDADASGANNGTSWTDAFVYLQDALDFTFFNNTGDYEIWVAEGVYYPDEDNVDTDSTGGPEHTDGNIYDSFKLQYNNAKVYGGFKGGETDLSQRDWETNLTILSGDIYQDDDNIDGNFISETSQDNNGLNSHHVVYFDGYYYGNISPQTILDGFTITAGQGNSGSANGYGGGLHCYAAGPMPSGVCSPSLRNLVIIGNYAELGGGMFLYTNDNGVSNPTFTNVDFIHNSGLTAGGAFYIYVGNHVDGESLPVFVNVRFTENHTNGNGGGLYIDSATGTAGGTLTNVELFGNDAVGNGGGIYIFGREGNINITINNATFSGNEAVIGGAMFNKLDTTAAHTFSMEISNSILWGNIGLTSHPEMKNDNATPLITNSDIEGCFDGGGSWVAAFGTNNGGNLDEDPKFTLPASGDLTLMASSPVIDAGNQALLPIDVTDLDLDSNFGETLPLDLAMESRVAGTGVDMGAYEYISAISTIGLYDPVTSKFYLKPENVSGGAGVNKFKYGPAGGGRLPISGDWDGDGTDTIGLYDPVTSWWYLKPDNVTGGAGVNKFKYGPAGGGRLPISGDWDGDGTDTIGLYDPVTSKFYLKPENVTGGAGVIKFKYGPAGGGRLPISGDWDGDVTDTIGLYDPVTSKFYLKPANVTGGAGVNIFKYGPAGGGRLPISGDWDGDVTDTIGLYDPVTSRFYLKPANVSGGAGVNKFKYGPAGGGRKPIAGDW